MLKNILLLLFASSSTISFAELRVWGPQVKEVNFSYSAKFLAKAKTKDMQEAAHDHFQHIYGLMKTQELSEKLGLDYDKVEGAGVPRDAVALQITDIKQMPKGMIEISYSAKGQILFHRKVADAVLARGLQLPLPYDVDHIYNIKCTDDHYQTEDDYWYFYDPFRKNCTYLLEEPYAKITKIIVSPSGLDKEEAPLNIDDMRDNPINKNTFSIYLIEGYADSARDSHDEGRVNFTSLNRFFRKNGFTEKADGKSKLSPIRILSKTIIARNGDTEEILVKHILTETDVSKNNNKFAAFFKEAVENGDVIVYSGHSGLGGNLDIASLEEDAGKFHFNNKKDQVFFIDSCSSYSYYMEMFASKKAPGTIHMVTNGLESTFDVFDDILAGFLSPFLDPDQKEIRWSKLLTNMESPLDGGSFLLNVGSN